jgi:cell wall-associated NlpC family hydrolase
VGIGLQVKAQSVADAAVSLLSMGAIPYVLGGASPTGMDCIGLVQWSVRECGGESNYVGSNDMWRRGLAWSDTIAEAQEQGKLVPGAAVYVVKCDGSEPGKYKGDGYGNACHVGMYCGAPNAEIVSASSVKKKVNAITLAQGWTHAAWLKSVDYSADAVESVQDEPTQPEIDMEKAIAAAKAFLEAVGELGGGKTA